MTQPAALDELEVQDVDEPRSDVAPQPDAKGSPAPATPAPPAPVAATPDYSTQLNAISVSMEALKGIPELAVNLNLLQEKQTLLAQKLAAGDTETLPQALQAIDRKYAQSRAGRQFELDRKDLEQEVLAAVVGPDGKPMLDANVAPELEAVRQLWNEGAAAKDSAKLARAVGQAQRIGRELYQKQVTASAAAVTEKAPPNVDLDLGTGSHGGSKMTWERAMNIKNVNDISDDDFFNLVAQRRG